MPQDRADRGRGDLPAQELAAERVGVGDAARDDGVAGRFERADRVVELVVAPPTSQVHEDAVVAVDLGRRRPARGRRG